MANMKQNIQDLIDFARKHKLHGSLKEACKETEDWLESGYCPLTDDED